MEDESQAKLSRKQTIDQRIAAIHTRLEELQELRPDPGVRTTATYLARLEAAHRRAAAAQAGARRALASSAQAFRNAAAAHDQTASEHAKAAASGGGCNPDEHLRQEAFHRAAAIADRQRAERTESLVVGVDSIAPTGPGSQNQLGGAMSDRVSGSHAGSHPSGRHAEDANPSGRRPPGHAAPPD